MVGFVLARTAHGREVVWVVADWSGWRSRKEIWLRRELVAFLGSSDKERGVDREEDGERGRGWKRR